LPERGFQTQPVISFTVALGRFDFFDCIKVDNIICNPP
jgi:hypothetical protein